MRFAKVYKNHREGFHSRYQPRDLLTLAILFFLLLATILLIIYFQRQTQYQQHASSSVQTLLNNTEEINYYPANNAWDNMWHNWNPTDINYDFARISEAGFTTVRIILQADNNAFAYPRPSATSLSELSQVLTLAANHNLKVHLTLFDWWDNYTDTTGSEQWANAIVKPYAADPRISIIEVQNEVDPTNVQTISWLQTMIPYIKSIDGGIPVTVSVWGASRMQTLVQDLLSTPPDFYDFHIYDSGAATYTLLQQVKTMVHGAPLFIGETGYSTYPQNNATPAGLAENQLSQESYQDYFYRTLFYATRGLSLPTPALWIYSDFTSAAIPANGTTDPKESYFGLFRTDGSTKPAFTTVLNALAGTPIDLSFNNGFETSDGNGLPTLWRVYQNPSLGFTANFTRDTTVSYNGVASAKISNSTNNAYGTASFYLNPVQYVLPGQTYTLSAWTKGANLTGSNYLSIAWFDSNNKYIKQDHSANVPTGTTNWGQLSLTAIVPAHAAISEIHLNSANNTGSVWFDDVAFTQSGITPHSELSSTPIPTLAAGNTTSTTNTIYAP